ncbi:hypothetical protein QYF61_008083 [Mycteria americana]|uniref:Uncharacterized protein n=1 Tax=Mycteria americana TaxID=33587 RepID=A0AAN7RMV2_MYCAM|nr:hypothetical protein QYF61_008083 [Mycteria americana]
MDEVEDRNQWASWRPVYNFSGGVLGWPNIDPKERGEPITIRIRGLSELAEGVQKAACIQVMYEREQQGIPMAAPVDPAHLRPLIRGLPDALKIHVQSLRERLQTAIERNWQNPPSPPAHVLTWAETLHSIATHGCDMGWMDPGGDADGSRRVRQASFESCPGQPPPAKGV